MFERELTLFQFNLNFLRMLAADIDESDMQSVAFPGANPPAWILGHLAVTTDYAAAMLGLERSCPRSWQKQFAPGTKPADLAPPLPSKTELVEAIETAYRRVSEAAPGASSEMMSQPHEIGLLKSTVLRTKGDVLAHLMTTHIAFHLAQLSAARRNAGKGPLV